MTDKPIPRETLGDILGTRVQFKMKAGTALVLICLQVVAVCGLIVAVTDRLN